ncbi:MMPL family transporter [Alkalicella caledoniensis]|uniref:MMPL family transporter n=1 Tax=Alkalicella caledoniensis TaxID=2731377 RepID=A0A7G9W9X3_ALKCA|nr:MMPL family transporter [Alkalicella caledoniensis]QNO15485.1 MMPL family transporter [Alkalicella caledoniensis]
MRYFAKILVEKRKIIMFIFLIISIISIFLIPLVGINYDLSAYLPERSNTREAMGIMQKEFSLTSHAQVMVEDISVSEAVLIKGQIEQVEGVKSVIWLDDLVDVYQPLEIHQSKVAENYYKDRVALFQVEFSEDEYSLQTGKAIEELKEVVGERALLRGTAVRSKALRESTLEEVFFITIFVVPIFLLILVITTRSWFEPVIYLFVIGISVIINMGTNLLFGEISFITLSSASVLQLALSMDYSLFLMHRFSEEREKGLDLREAMVKAITKSFSSLAASCLTTVAGFVALMFMRYRIGLDMSLVLGKGIILSLISVIFLLPSVTILSDRIIQRTYHGSFLPSLGIIANGILKKGVPGLVIVGLLVIPGYFAQSSNTFVYGESAVIEDEDSIVGSHQQQIEAKFGVDNPMILLLPPSDRGKENELVKALMEKEYISSIHSLVTLVDPYIPKEVIPRGVLDNFLTQSYSRMVLALDVPVESEITFLAVEDLKGMVHDYYGEGYYLLGSSASVAEIKDLVDKDFTMVDIISVVAVAFIMMIAFRSLSLPILLVLVIKSAIWINMSVPYFMDRSLSFVGYMIVSAVQLGATIDYAILLSNRYMDNRRIMEKKEAAIQALENSGWSIITSALILFVAGMGVYIISTVGEVSEMGLLIGRGALLSGSMVFIVLPQLLVIFDPLIVKTTVRWKHNIENGEEI